MAIIGRATTRSAPDIAKVHVETWRAAYAHLIPDKVLLNLSPDRQAQEWHRIIRGGNTPVIVAAEIGRGVVGFASCGRARSGHRPNGGPFAAPTQREAPGEIYTLYVLPDYQGLGIGRQLLTAALQAMADGDCDRALVWVLSANPARYFYEAMGAQIVAERVERLWGTDLDETAYGWPDLKQAIARLGSLSTP